MQPRSWWHLVACGLFGLGASGCGRSGRSSQPATSSSQAIAPTPQVTPQSVPTQFSAATCGSTAGLQANAAWPAFGGCPTDERASPQVGTQSNYLNWTATTGGEVQSSPAIGADGTVYVGANDGKVYALTSDGVVKWSTALGGPVHGSPAIGAYGTNGTLYVGADSGGLYALNPSTGAILWNFAILLPVRSSPIVGSDGTVYFAGPGQGINVVNNYLYALTPKGTVRFQTAINATTSSAPAIATSGGVTYVYVASDGALPIISPKTLYAINAATGAIAWQKSFGATSTSGPAVGANGTIYLGSGQESLVAVSPSGAVTWTFSLGCLLCNINATPAIGPDGNVYVGSSDGRFFSINGASGAQRWVQSLGTNVDASAAIDATGTVYIGSASGDTLFAMNSSGTEVFSVATGGAIESSVAIGAYGTIYFGGDDSRVYSVGERYSGFVQGANSAPIGTCNDNRVPSGTQATVCLQDPAAGATIVNMYVNGHMTTSTNDCVTIPVTETVEIRSFEYSSVGVLAGTHVVFLTTTSTTKHCPIYDNILLGTPGDDVLVGTSGDEYISGGPGVDYIVSGGGNDVLVSGDEAHTFDLTGPLSASALGPGLEIVGANLAQDQVIVNFAPSTLPTTLFDVNQACTAPACQGVNPSFENIYTSLEAYTNVNGGSVFTQPRLSSIRQVYDVGGGYIACGSRSVADASLLSANGGSGIEGLIVKLSPSGAIEWVASSATNVGFYGKTFSDIQAYYTYDSNNDLKRTGYVLVGSQFVSGESFIQVVDLQGNQLAFNFLDGTFLNGSGQVQGNNGNTGQSVLSKVVSGPGFVIAVGSTPVQGSSPMPNGSYVNEPGGKGYVVAFRNHITGGQLDQLLTEEGFAPNVSSGVPGNTLFDTATLVPPSAGGTLWSIALGGESGLNLPAAAGATSPPQPSAFLTIAQLGGSITNPSSGGGSRITPIYESEFLGGSSPMAAVSAVTNVPGTGLLFGGSTDAYEQNNPFQPSSFLTETDDTLTDLFTTADPNAGSFFQAAPGYEFLGGYSSTGIASLSTFPDGTSIAFGQSQFPWSNALLTTAETPEFVGPGCAFLAECINGEFAAGSPQCTYGAQECQGVQHALFVYLDGTSRTYHTYGHDTANTATHAITTVFAGAELTPDHGFIAAGVACPGADFPCIPEAYVVKASPEPSFSSPGLPCSCSNGYADCGESPTGYASATATHPGDCGGPCAACVVDCGDGIQDYGEQNIDCGGPCTNPDVTPTHQAIACMECTTSQCAAAAPPCMNGLCDPNSGCYNQPIPATPATACGTENGQAMVCDGAGNCVYACSATCPAPTEPCMTAACTSESGCTAVPETGTSCTTSDGVTPGTCNSGTCTPNCVVSNCTGGGPCTTASCSTAGSGSCVYTAVPEGTACGGAGSGMFCMNNSCETPYYTNLASSSSSAPGLLFQFCQGCHLGNSMSTYGALSSSCNGSCFLSCYSEATKAAIHCPESAENGQGVFHCIGSAVSAGAMPASPNCTGTVTPLPAGCPTPAEIAVITSWVQSGAPYSAANPSGSTAPACP